MLHTVECRICRPNNFVSKCMLQMMSTFGTFCIISFLLSFSLQKKSVREGLHEASATYKNFRIWLDDTSPTEEMRKQVMEEDEKYTSPQTTPPVREEVDIYTSSSESSLMMLILKQKIQIINKHIIIAFCSCYAL